VFEDLEEVVTTVIATAKSNAFKQGVQLMSVEFVGIESAADLFDVFGQHQLTDTDRATINRRWDAEHQNRVLYEEAIKKRFREMRIEGITDVGKYDTEALRIREIYRKRKRLVLKDLETVVAKEQGRLLTRLGFTFVGPPAPETKSAESMTSLELLKKLRQKRGANK